ncbi:MAG: DNA repair protein RecN [Propionibacteriaceae bacterium]|jgi:DNA repair protein RecN (Recombination protein N)|nr:DNA repair protein RecN [Propionibacteriaceae bacterium]
MLDQLIIGHLGVIDQASFQPGRGLTVISGETGAGKTMVVTGINMLLGARIETSLTRGHSQPIVVEGRFSQTSAQVAELVDTLGGDLDDDQLWLTRQVNAAGRSRSWVAGAPVTQSNMALIGEELVTIHGQAEQQRLVSPDRQRQVLDEACGPAMTAAIKRYQGLFAQRRSMRLELDELHASLQERVREIDYVRFGLAEINAVSPAPNEDSQLQSEAARLQDSDDLENLVLQAQVNLFGDDESGDQGVPAINQLANVVRSLDALAARDPAAQALARQARDLQASAADLGADINRFADGLTADPVRLDWIESRLAQLKVLTRKYGATIDEVLDWQAQAELRLDQLTGSDDRIAALEHELEAIEGPLQASAADLTALRRATASRLSSEISQELVDLAMPAARVEFTLEPLSELGPWGAESVAMLFVANAGGTLAPLGRSASGGELSRVRLAIEVILTKTDSGRTMIFDEIDAGIGGATGLQVGSRLARLAEHCQVIVVTHLAQVAVFGQTHVVVNKTTAGDVTMSDLQVVEGPERLAELARMMGGLSNNESGLAHAAELLRQAERMLA